MNETEAALDDQTDETPVSAELEGENSEETPEESTAGDAEVDAAVDEMVEEPHASSGRWSADQVEATIEALLFASPDVLPLRAIRRILPDGPVTGPMIDAALDALVKRHTGKGSGVVLAEVGGGWQFQTREEHFPFVQQLVKVQKEEKVTSAALETLAIIAYKQPITRAEVDNIRGVGCGQIIRTLMDRNMVRVVGRVELPGRPFQYGTTQHFLEHFGLRSLGDLPGEKDL